MSKMKKTILITVFLTVALILGFNNKALATDRSHKINDTVQYSFSDMKNANNLYCVANEKAFKGGKIDFKIQSYVEIEGKNIKVGACGDESNIIVTQDNDNNATLAAILGGALEQGYGDHGDYREAQRALYSFWNTWVDSVGANYGFSRYNENDKISANAEIAKAKSAAQQKNYHVIIYNLKSGKDNMQQLILVDVLDSSTPGTPDTPNPPAQEPTNVTGYINISGYVWEDISNSKSNTINSQYEEGDARVEGIRVHWRANNGTEIASTTTGSDGSYKMTTTIALTNHPYSIKDTAKYDLINNSYIEFEYNGLKYTTVAYNGNLSCSDTSKGKEDESSRSNLDNKFDKVENRAVYDGNSAIISDLPNTQITNANYASEFAVSASTRNIVRTLMKTSESNNWVGRKQFCMKHCENERHIMYNETYKDSYIRVYCDGTVDIYDPKNHWTAEHKNSINGNTGKSAHYYSADETNGPLNRDCLQGEQKIYEWNIYNMNLGLVRREQPDAAISSDIEKVRVIMKNQEYTYQYGNRGIQNNQELFDYKVKFGNKYMQTYTRAVNPADVAYVSYNNTDDLKVYVTYNMTLKNQSNTLPMQINSLVNYYDSDYSIYTGAGSSTSAGWQETNNNNNGFKVAYYTNGITLQPGAQSEVIKLEFEVSQSKIKELQKEDAGFKFTNYVEIFSFTTNYGKDTICAERESAEAKGKVGQQYAGLDEDSTPGNTVPGNESTYEDDTDRAPSFLLKKDPNYKTMTGTVYEDTQTSQSQKENERLGNGYRDGNEKGVENVRVELLDAQTGKTAYIYYKDTSTESGANRKLAITYTDKDGKYTFGEAGSCGVVANEYIIKYTYGNADKGADGDGNIIGKTTIDGGSTYINARNYKSTIITDSYIKSIISGEATSDKWHLFLDENVDKSIAVDDLQERLAQETLKNSNYDKEENMSAYSKKFYLQLEYTKEQNAKVDNNGGEFAHDLTVFDFGIIERPREDVTINKTISKVKLTLANGQVLFDGDPRKDKLNYVKAIGIKERENARFEAMDAEKALAIEIDQELIQGAKLEVWYMITFTNDSEKDYEYANNSNYYYYGTDKTEVMGIANLVVDYMNSSMVCDIGDDYKSNGTNEANNAEWYKYDNGTATDAEYLKENGYISYKSENDVGDAVYETLKENKSQSILTNTFANVLPGQTKESVLYASKILASQEENHLYENHVEVIALNGKTARTIKSVSDNERTQVQKEYQPGNYIPSLSVNNHQQDDDRVRITVTPPTGTTNYTTVYIISAVLGLIVITGAIILIKRRFLNK